ncbi:hypothetical protein [Mesorhizobium sp.]|uniref:hypothetical protein n=1 Tax=Mesorhizobium sp. TaxID=1871066 RepID=UPI000FE82C0C|nr:hypothetical protein [Mesorhizobium sp.]RWP63834.1 MAG: hypothetical protein EOR08_10170 [Mesorhizobium sp.]
MRITLSKHQRWAALGVAAVIVLVQFWQFSENGFEGYGWAGTFLIAGMLILIGLGPAAGFTVGSAERHPTKNPTEAAHVPERAPLNEDDLKAKHDVLRENAELLAVEVEARGDALADELIAKRTKDFEGLTVSVRGSAEKGTQLMGGVDDFIRERSMLLMLGLVGLRRAKGYNLHITGLEYRTMQKAALDTLAKRAIQAHQKEMPDLPIERDALLKHLMDELKTVKTLIGKGCAAPQDREAPLVEWFAGFGFDLTGSPHVANALAVREEQD